MVKGWQENRDVYGNSILNATDAVCEVGLPWERHEINYLQWKDRKGQYYGSLDNPESYRFQISVALSKRGLKYLQSLAGAGKGDHT